MTVVGFGCGVGAVWHVWGVKLMRFGYGSWCRLGMGLVRLGMVWVWFGYGVGAVWHGYEVGVDLVR